jgi:hypothetical protein
MEQEHTNSFVCVGNLANITFTGTSSFISFSSGTFKKSNSVTGGSFAAFRFLTHLRLIIAKILHVGMGPTKKE